MLPHDENDIDQRLSAFISSAGRNALDPDMAFLDRLREQSTVTFMAATVEIPKRFRGYRIMQARTLKWLIPAAAGAAVLVVIGLFPSKNNSGRVYGMSDVPDLLRSAKTLYIRGWKRPEDGEPLDPFEEWIDAESGRTRTITPAAYFGPDAADLGFVNRVYDGEYAMEEYICKPVHGDCEKRVRFRRFTPFMKLIRVAREQEQSIWRIFGNVDRWDGFSRTGQEQINGTVFDVWQGEVDSPAGGTGRLETWLSPTTGEIGRLRIWEKQGDQWILYSDFDHIERDVVLPEGIFSTEPSPGIKLENDKETAPLIGLDNFFDRGVERYALIAHIGFTLSDGSVLLAWSSPDNQVSSQEELFKALTPGGDLPMLPGQIVSMTPLPNKNSVTYIGRHFTYTQKDGRFYEWSLYVPEQVPPSRRNFINYTFQIHYNADKDKFGSYSSGLAMDSLIGSEEDFNKWVLGAWAELSDNTIIPDYVTYESVMQLSRQLREAHARD